MVTWFNLPPEVKQIIFSMVSDADSIIYVPRDRRRTVDVRHLEAHHFHDLLLVSKTFITSDEFAFAILKSAKLTFYSYNEFRRLITEVPSSFKESIRSIHLSRTHAQDIGYLDTFGGFSAIDTTLSTHMPQLRRIFISWPGYCAQVALCQMTSASPFSGGREPTCSSIVEDILSDKPWKEISAGRILHQNSLSHVAASFLGNRNTPRGVHYWIRPLGWIRRLMSYAEDNGIEVVLQIDVCVGFVQVNPFPPIPVGQDILTSCCWSTSGTHAPNVSVWRVHVEAEMSSRDYILRVEHDGRKFAYYQKLGYDLVHSSSRRGMKYWLSMVRDVHSRLPGTNVLSAGDKF